LPARRPIKPHDPAPAGAPTTFHQVATGGGVLCIERKSCSRRAALTKNECPAIRSPRAQPLPTLRIVQILKARLAAFHSTRL
jgi:hypothetical protein